MPDHKTARSGNWCCTFSPVESRGVALSLGPLAFVELQPVVSPVNFVELGRKCIHCPNAMWYIDSLHRDMLKQLNSSLQCWCHGQFNFQWSQPSQPPQSVCERIPTLRHRLCPGDPLKASQWNRSSFPTDWKPPFQRLTSSWSMDSRRKWKCIWFLVVIHSSKYPEGLMFIDFSLLFNSPVFHQTGPHSLREIRTLHLKAGWITGYDWWIGSYTTWG